MNYREQIEKAIRALEAERELLGDAVVDVTVATLQELLAQPADFIPPDSRQPVGQPKTATILAAQLIGLELLEEYGPAGTLLALTDALWQRLGQVVRQAGGEVDRHIGFVLTAVFGLDEQQKDVPVRAVQAALAMEVVFRDFVAAIKESGIDFGAGLSVDYLPDANNSQKRPLVDSAYNLCLGLNSGPVFVERLEGGEQMLGGDVVNVAYRLTHDIAAGGIYVTDTTHNQIADYFDTRPVPVTAVTPQPDRGTIYRVLGARPRLPDLSGWEIAGAAAMLVGREEPLHQLRQLWVQAGNGQGQMVTIVGDAGLGKSRLAFEFDRWARQQNADTLVLRARAEQGTRPFPYTLVRDLLATALDIQNNEPAVLVGEKLVTALPRLHLSEADLRRQAELLGQLVGLGVIDDATAVDHIDLPASDSQARYVRERALTVWARLVQYTTRSPRPTLIFLEDLHQADAESLYLLTHVDQILARTPVLIVGLAQPALYDRWPRWPHLDSGHALTIPHTRLDLLPLSMEGCRRLVENILRHLGHESVGHESVGHESVGHESVGRVPEALVTLIVNQAEGNPFYVEELIRLLIDNGLIQVTDAGWEIQAQDWSRLRLPATLLEVLQARLNHLSPLERVVLQRASVMGHTFWETAVLTMHNPDEAGQSSAEIMAALAALEKRGLISRQPTSMFAGTDAYLFKHNLLQQVAYETILLRQRPLYHKQVADWLIEQSGERVAEWAVKIAAHYELADESVLAAELYEIAGRRAQIMSNLEVAIDNYRKTIALVTDKPRHALWLLRLQEGIGPLLLRRLRLVEAAQVYMTMQYAADIDGELALQAKAWLGLAMVQREQCNYLAMLHAAEHAYTAARLVTAHKEEVSALLAQSEAFIYLGRLSKAQQPAQEAMTLSRQLSLQPQQAMALNLLCHIYKNQGQTELALSLRRQLEQRAAALLETKKNDRKMKALYHLILAGFYRVWEEWTLVSANLKTATDLYEALPNPVEWAQAQAARGRLAQQQSDAEEAVVYLRQAAELSATVGDEYGRMRYQLYLAQALLKLAQTEEAAPVLSWLLDRIDNSHRMVDWWGRLTVYELVVAFHLIRREPDLALNAARQAYAVAQKRDRQRDKAVAWRLLAEVLQRLRPHTTTITVDEQRYDVTGCFARSWQCLEAANAQVPGHRLRAEQTLRLWRAYEAEQMRPEELEAAFSEREATLSTYFTWDELHPFVTPFYL